MTRGVIDTKPVKMKKAMTKGPLPLDRRQPKKKGRGKKVLLFLMVLASICVVAAWGVFAVKPEWLDEVKERLTLLGSSDKVITKSRGLVRSPLRSILPSKEAEEDEEGWEEEEEEEDVGGKTTVKPPAQPPASLMRPRVYRPGVPVMRRPAVPTQPQPPFPTTPAVPPVASKPEIAVPVTPGMVTPAPIIGGAERPPITTPSATKREESDAEDYLEIATIYAKKGDYQKAEGLLQKAARENPSSAKAHNNLGFALLHQQKYDMAEREFKEAIRLDPGFVLPYYNLACLYSRKGVDVEALVYLKRAIKRDERVKEWAKEDKDFDRLRSDVVFQELVGEGRVKKEDKEAQGEGALQTQQGITKGEGTQLEGAAKVEGSQTPLSKEDTVRVPPAVAPAPIEKKKEIPPSAGPTGLAAEGGQ